MGALESWRDHLASWAIPEPVLAAAPESPWALPRGLFTRRTDQLVADPSGPSFEQAAEALAVPGSVIDVGAGAGAASLPLAGRLTEVTAVDTDEEMLAAFAERAGRVGVPVRLVTGRWPEVAASVPPADVVVCSYVLYNVPDLGPFATALTGHARRRVVVEITERHPLTPLNPLWRRLHGIERPDRPTAADAVAALREAGINPRVIRWDRPADPEYRTFDELVASTRRRLCLPEEASGQVRAALLDLGVDPVQPRGLGPARRELVTLSWDGTG